MIFWVFLGNSVCFGIFWILLLVFRGRLRLSWIDCLWSLNIGLWGVGFLGSALLKESINFAWVFPVLLCFWSARLSHHLWSRLKRHLGEDRRYREFQDKHGSRWPQQSLWVIGMNAVVSTVLLIPQVVWWGESQALGGLQGFSAFLCVLALWGEAQADRELKKHKASGSALTLQTGLWRYSRHPNYFFEWLFWLGQGLFVLNLRLGWGALLAPLVVYVLLDRVTGVGPVEAAAESRRPDFAEYRRRTSRFFPWFPREG